MVELMRKPGESLGISIVGGLLTDSFNATITLSVFFIVTVRLHVMQRTVLLSEFCPSVRPSVRQMRVL